MRAGAQLLPFNPFLIKAVDGWIRSNQLTPYIVVDASVPGVEVPIAYVKDNQITLNLSYISAVFLQMTEEGVEFDARFNGVAHHLRIPYLAIRAIFAKEDPQHTTFLLPPSVPAEAHVALQAAEIQAVPTEQTTPPESPPSVPRQRGHLTLVKS